MFARCLYMRTEKNNTVPTVNNIAAIKFFSNFRVGFTRFLREQQSTCRPNAVLVWSGEYTARGGFMSVVAPFAKRAVALFRKPRTKNPYAGQIEIYDRNQPVPGYFGRVREVILFVEYSFAISLRSPSVFGHDKHPYTVH